MIAKIKIVLYIIFFSAMFIGGIKFGDYIRGLEKENGRLHEELIGKSEEYRQISKSLAQLRSDYVQQQELAAKSEQRFKGLLRAKNERIKVLSDATYLIGRHVSKQNGPDYYFQTPKGTKNYILNELRIQGDGSPAIGYILIKNDGRTYKRNYAFEIRVEQLQTVDEESGRIKVYSKAFLIPKETSPLAKRIEGYKDWKDLKYPLKITGGTALVDPTVKNQLEPKFHWWAPHLNANLNFGSSEIVSPGLGISLAGYGSVRNDLDWRFLQLGADYIGEEKFSATITPALWRPIPKILSNTYIGPGLKFKPNGVGYFLGLHIGL